MEAMGSPPLSHNMSYDVVQAMFFLVAGARRIELLGEIEAAHVGCGSRVTELGHRVSKLGDYLQCSKQKYQLLFSEKSAMEEVSSALEAKVDSLTQINEGLMIQVESLERDVADRDRLITALQVSANATQRDLDWLLQAGLVRVVDMLIEHPDFTSVVSLICHSAFVVRAESVRSTLASVGPENLVISTPSFGPVVSVNEAFLSFVNMDNTSLLGLGDLDIQRILELCAFSDSKCTPEGMVGDGDEVARDGENVVGEDTPSVFVGVDGCVVGGAGGGMDGGVGGNVDVDGKDIGGDVVVIVDEKLGVESGGGDDFVGDKDAPTSCTTPPGA